MTRSVKFYRTPTGNCPVQEFLDSLSGKVARKLIWVLKLVEDLEVVPSQYFRKLNDTDDIWECRVSFGGNIYRVFSFWDRGEVILTHGFIKKSQKTPQGEIERAEAVKKEYRARYKGGRQ